MDGWRGDDEPGTAIICPAGQNCEVCGRSVFLTGGTGSFGTAFTEILLREHSVRRLVLFSRDEWKQSEMERRLSRPDVLRFRLGDIRDPTRLRLAIQDAEIVIHAAALKQITQGVHNPSEIVQTNILGTQHVLEAALEERVGKVVILSSDKSCHPINAYGGSKFMAEQLAVSWNTYAYPRGCRVSAVRYGNVLGSRGSVVHLFREAVAAGRALPVTDPEMTRFWITLPEAVNFVLNVLTFMRGGEVFIPVLPSMRIADLAEALAPGHPIDVVGIRPGEKLHELLIGEDEADRAVIGEDMFILEPTHLSWPRPRWAGQTAPKRWRYASDSEETIRLTVKEMRTLLKQIPLTGCQPGH